MALPCELSSVVPATLAIGWLARELVANKRKPAYTLRFSHKVTGKACKLVVSDGRKGLLSSAVHEPWKALPATRLCAALMDSLNTQSPVA